MGATDPNPKQTKPNQTKTPLTMSLQVVDGSRHGLVLCLGEQGGKENEQRKEGREEGSVSEEKRLQTNACALCK